jgi:hypothetical protein
MYQAGLSQAGIPHGAFVTGKIEAAHIRAAQEEILERAALAFEALVFFFFHEDNGSIAAADALGIAVESFGDNFAKAVFSICKLPVH